MGEAISKGKGVADSQTPRVVAADDALFTVRGITPEGTPEPLRVKTTGELDLPAIEQRLDNNLGARTDSAATSDGGAFSLIALFKRLLFAKFNLTVAELRDSLRDSLRGANAKTLSDVAPHAGA
jgi:hypothetical protein